MARWRVFVVLTFLIADAYSGSKSKVDWWETSVIYQIYPRSFKDSDGDGIGDINGIISKVDYLAETGIEAIWLSPIFKSPMVDSGYDIADFLSLDPTFGTIEDFDNLRKVTKDKGIKILLDFVPNHSSDQHEWFQKSVMNDTKYKDYYIWRNGRIIEETYEELPPNNWVSVFGGSAWTWNEDRGQYYLHQFSKAQPDLNFRNPDVVKDMKDVLTFWLDKGVDGFRVDAISHLYEAQNFSHEMRSSVLDARPGNYSSLLHNFTRNLPETHDMVAQWRELLDKYSKKDGSTRVILTESVGNEKREVIAYYGNTSYLEAHFPFNFDLIFQITNNSKAKEFKRVIENQPSDHWGNWVTGNHDNHRVASRLGRDMVDIMNMLVLLLPGTAITYNGEEIGMEDTPITWEEAKDPQGINAGKMKFARFSRDPERTPFQWNGSENAGFSTNKTWLPVNPNYKELNLESQIKQTKSHYKTYKRLVAARKEPAIQTGKLLVKTLNDDVLTFTRELKENQSFLVAINFGPIIQRVEFSTYPTLKGNFTVYATSINSVHEIGSNVSKEILLSPKEAVVLVNPPHREAEKYSVSGGSSGLQYFNISLMLATVLLSVSRYISST